MGVPVVFPIHLFPSYNGGRARQSPPRVLVKSVLALPSFQRGACSGRGNRGYFWRWGRRATGPSSRPLPSHDGPLKHSKGVRALRLNHRDSRIMATVAVSRSSTFFSSRQEIRLRKVTMGPSGESKTIRVPHTWHFAHLSRTLVTAPPPVGQALGV